LGNYLGAIKNYIKLQEEYECVYCIVDLHALTTLETTKDLRQNTLEMALDWLAAGMDPEKSIIFVQSQVRQVTELHTILSMVTPLGKLTDLPTFKEKAREHPHNINYGLVGYPVLMAADIALYKADLVPVGIDQAPHIEFTRETVRSFNYHFNTNVLIEPQMKVTEFPKIIGIDGVQKMGKSLNNEIEIAATPDETRQRVMMMVTDPNRQRRSDPGNPDVCNVYSLHKIFTAPEEVANINTECRRAGIGCVDCKKKWLRASTSTLPHCARNATNWPRTLRLYGIFCRTDPNGPARSPNRPWSKFAKPSTCLPDQIKPAPGESRVLFYGVSIMRAVIQRVNYGKVVVDGQTVASIQKGLVILLGIAPKITPPKHRQWQRRSACCASLRTKTKK
jgi:tryptophanyl-tRNA synthetase